MALTEIVYRRLRVFTNAEEIEWVSLETCLAEVAEELAKKKLEKKKRHAMNRAVKREEKKLRSSADEFGKGEVRGFQGKDTTLRVSPAGCAVGRGTLRPLLGTPIREGAASKLSSNIVGTVVAKRLNEP